MTAWLLCEFVASLCAGGHAVAQWSSVQPSGTHFIVVIGNDPLMTQKAGINVRDLIPTAIELALNGNLVLASGVAPDKYVPGVDGVTIMAIDGGGTQPGCPKPPDGVPDGLNVVRLIDWSDDNLSQLRRSLEAALRSPCLFRAQFAMPTASQYFALPAADQFVPPSAGLRQFKRVRMIIFSRGLRAFQPDEEIDKLRTTAPKAQEDLIRLQSLFSFEQSALSKFDAAMAKADPTRMDRAWGTSDGGDTYPYIVRFLAVNPRGFNSVSARDATLALKPVALPSGSLITLKPSKSPDPLIVTAMSGAELESAVLRLAMSRLSQNGERPLGDSRAFDLVGECMAPLCELTQGNDRSVFGIRLDEWLKGVPAYPLTAGDEGVSAPGASVRLSGSLFVTLKRSPLYSHLRSFSIPVLIGVSVEPSVTLAAYRWQRVWQLSSALTLDEQELARRVTDDDKDGLDRLTLKARIEAEREQEAFHWDLISVAAFIVLIAVGVVLIVHMLRRFRLGMEFLSVANPPAKASLGSGPPIRVATLRLFNARSRRRSTASSARRVRIELTGKSCTESAQVVSSVPLFIFAQGDASEEGPTVFIGAANRELEVYYNPVAIDDIRLSPDPRRTCCVQLVVHANGKWHESRRPHPSQHSQRILVELAPDPPLDVEMTFVPVEIDDLGRTLVVWRVGEPVVVGALTVSLASKKPRHHALPSMVTLEARSEGHHDAAAFAVAPAVLELSAGTTPSKTTNLVINCDVISPPTPEHLYKVTLTGIVEGTEAKPTLNLPILLHSEMPVEIRLAARFLTTASPVDPVEITFDSVFNGPRHGTFDLPNGESVHTEPLLLHAGNSLSSSVPLLQLDLRPANELADLTLQIIADAPGCTSHIFGTIDDLAGNEVLTTYKSGMVKSGHTVVVAAKQVMGASLLGAARWVALALDVTIMATTTGGAKIIRGVKLRQVVRIQSPQRDPLLRDALCIDFGTSAIVVYRAPDDQPGPVLVNLQEVRAGDTPREETIAALDKDNREAGSAFLPSWIACDSDLLSSAVSHGQAGYPTHVDRTAKPGMPGFVSLPARRIVESVSPERIIVSVKSWLSSGSADIPYMGPPDKAPPVPWRRDELATSTFGALFSAYLRDCLRPRWPRVLVTCYPNTFMNIHKDRLERVIRAAAREAFNEDIPSQIRLVSESDAILAGYLATQRPSPDHQEYLVVYDFGAGTVDLTLASAKWGEDGQVQRVRVLNRLGIPLAGNAIDEALAYLVDDELCRILDPASSGQRFDYTTRITSSTPEEAAQQSKTRLVMLEFWQCILRAKQGNGGPDDAWDGTRPLCVGLGPGSTSLVSQRGLSAGGTDQGTPPAIGTAVVPVPTIRGDNDPPRPIEPPATATNPDGLVVIDPADPPDVAESRLVKDANGDHYLLIPAQVVLDNQRIKDLTDCVTEDAIEILLNGGNPQLTAEQINRVIPSGRGVRWWPVREKMRSLFRSPSDPKWLESFITAGGQNLKSRVAEGALQWIRMRDKPGFVENAGDQDEPPPEFAAWHGSRLYRLRLNERVEISTGANDTVHLVCMPLGFEEDMLTQRRNAWRFLVKLCDPITVPARGKIELVNLGSRDAATIYCYQNGTPVSVHGGPAQPFEPRVSPPWPVGRTVLPKEPE